MDIKRFSVGPAGAKPEEFHTPKMHGLVYIFIFLGALILLVSLGFYYNETNQTNIISKGFSYVSSGVVNLGQTLYSTIVGKVVDGAVSSETSVVTETAPAPATETTPTSETTIEAMPVEIPATEDQTTLPIGDNVILQPPSPPVVDEITTEQPIEGGGAGTENISVEFNGTNPATELIGTQIAIIDSAISTVVNMSQNMINQTETLANETIVNETIIEENVSSGINKVTTTKQYSAVIGKPVKWEKKVKIEKSDKPQENIATQIDVELPSIAGEIVVKKVDGETGNSQEITLNADIKNEKNVGEVQPIVSVTGSAVAESTDGNGFISRLLRVFRLFMAITGRAVDELLNPSDTPVSVSVAESVSNNDEIVVEYYTAAPYAEETIIDDSKKEITVVGPDEVRYEEVLAYSEIPVEVNDAKKIKLYWTSSDSGEKENVIFEAKDTDGNGLIDTIEWIVPHLSNQTYEIILITKAVHLDANRSEIADIYNFVKTQDGNWSETIKDGEYVRVTFEIPLDNTRDITVYARPSCNNSIKINNVDVPCDIYYKKLRLDALRK